MWHVQPSDYGVAVYIFVSGWWTKPSFADPVTSIHIDGGWTTDITTGGIDEKATAIATFLIPNSYVPPLLSGSATLSGELYQNTVANVQVNRN